MTNLASYDRDDGTFVDDLRRSDEAVARVARWFAGKGWDVRKPALRVRPAVEQMADYADSGDLFVRRAGDTWHRLEVAVRRIRFTCAADYPYPLIIVDSAHAWLKANPKPIAYMRISETMRHAAFILSNTSDRWVRQIKHDKAKKRDREFMLCSKHLARFVATPGL